jgi:polygalacturonase
MANRPSHARFLALTAVIPLLAGAAALGSDPKSPSADLMTGEMTAILRRIVPPKFPDRQFDVTRYGAIGDGKTVCTAAFREAISQCNKSGGGTVIVPAGTFLTGPIHFQSDVELRLAKDAEVKFSDHFEDYLPPVLVRVGGIELYNYSPLIYAQNCRNIAITGPGRLNGNARAWWPWARKETKEFFDRAAHGVPVEQRIYGTPEAAIRPSFVCLMNCTNVLLSDFTIGSGPNWTIHPVYCQDTTIRNVTVDTEGPNNDGIDPDSCRDMLIEHCSFSTGDDCVVLKSGYNEDGWRVARPTENVIMRYCSSKRGHGGLVIGSEMSGGVRNVYLHDCEFEGTDRAIRIKSRRGRAGTVEHIFARDLKVKNLQHEVVILNMDYSSDQKQAANEKPPVFRDMQFENISGDGAPTAILIQGLEDSPIENIRFGNLRIRSTAGVVATHVKGLQFSDLKFEVSKGPMFRLNDASQVVIQKVNAPPNTDVFLQLDGARSRGNRIETCDLSGATRKVAAGEGVPADAVELP